MVVVAVVVAVAVGVGVVVGVVVQLTDNTMTAEQYFQSVNGGKPSEESDMITAKWAVIMMGDFNKAYKSALRKAIELKIETLKTIQARTKDFPSSYDAAIAAYEQMLKTMDEVTPE